MADFKNIVNFPHNYFYTHVGRVGDIDLYRNRFFVIPRVNKLIIKKKANILPVSPRAYNILNTVYRYYYFLFPCYTAVMLSTVESFHCIYMRVLLHCSYSVLIFTSTTSFRTPWVIYVNMCVQSYYLYPQVLYAELSS